MDGEGKNSIKLSRELNKAHPILHVVFIVLFIFYLPNNTRIAEGFLYKNNSFLFSEIPLFLWIPSILVTYQLTVSKIVNFCSHKLIKRKVSCIVNNILVPFHLQKKTSNL